MMTEDIVPAQETATTITTSAITGAVGIRIDGQVADRRPTPKEAEDTMRRVMRRTHEVLSHALSCRYPGLDDPASDPKALSGLCGLAQSFAYQALKDEGIVSKPVALETLPGSASSPHVTLTAELDTTHGKKVYLLDKTYLQFCGGKDGEPGQVLARMPEGNDILDALCKQGFIELTPLRASSYLGAFNHGRAPFATGKETMDFFANPTPSKMNLWRSRADLERWGYIGNPPAPPKIQLSPLPAQPKPL